MKIELHSVTIGELTAGYQDSDEDGVVGYGGRLDIRPKYQREFVYDDKKKMAVMETVWKGFPLNVMYWVRRADGGFELLDGQQRTLSICKYVAGEYFMNFDGALKGWCNLSAEERKRINSYELQIYICEGTPDEQLDWFRIINIAGERLTDQELLNAVYNGSWVTSAKRRFSKTGCAAYRLGERYMSGSPIRQDYLETALDWISEGAIQHYMAAHQHDSNSDELWQYFQEVIGWVQRLFIDYYKEMKGLPWGKYYNAHKNNPYRASDLREQIKALMEDVDVSNKRGIFAYVLSGDERHLNIRAFDARMKREAYQRQKGICPHCGEHFAIDQMEGDHITPWCEGGKTVAENCQMLCKTCNRRKSNK